MHTMKKKEKFFGLLGISTVSIISFGSIYTNSYINNVSATTQTKTTTANASVRVSNFCSMTANIQPGEEHSTTLIGGQYQSDIGKTTIQTFCNDPNGYAIYAIGYTGEDAGVAAGTNTVLHSTALGSTYDIVTGIAQSGDTSNWAMKLTSVDGTYKPDILSDDSGSFSDYHIVPQSYTKVASYSANTDLDNPASTRQGSKLTTTYAAYISPTQDAGTYEGAVKYVLINPNNTVDDLYNMQDVEYWGNGIAIGQEVTAYDIRDNKAYTVRRMCMEGNGSNWQEKEANCTSSMLWMTQNLDLDLNENTELTSEDTDLRVVDNKAYSAGYSQDSLDIIHWNPINDTVTSINTSSGRFNNWTNSDTVISSADPDAGSSNNLWYATGESYNPSPCYVDNNNQTCNYLNSGNTVAQTYFSHTPFTGNGNHGKIGNYYNWSAAIASNNSSSLTASTYGNATNNPKNSICPKGWRLPTISSVGANNEFARLIILYIGGGNVSDGYKMVLGPLYFTLSGFVSGGYGILNSAGYMGGYWSSTIDDAGFSYDMSFRDGNIVRTHRGNRYIARSVRCVSDY